MLSSTNSLSWKISQQPENCENRKDPDLVQAFLKKWWVESDFKAPNLPVSLRLKVSGCHGNTKYEKMYIRLIDVYRQGMILRQITHYSPRKIP
jgi:hypothetical protein